MPTLSADGLEQLPAGPLSWLRVVDLTDLRGAMCARILADLGADVLRAEGPEVAVGTRESSAYRYRNANKRGVSIDVASPDGRARLRELLAAADVLVENLDARQRGALGLTRDDLAASHPGLVHVSLADMGLDGPRSDWRLEALPAQAASGALYGAGLPELPPCNAPGHFAHDCASVYGAVGAVAGVLDRARHGLGQQVEVSVQEAGLAGSNPWSIALEDYLKINPLFPASGRRNGDGSYWVLPAADGWVRAIISTPRQWDGFVQLLGSPDALTGPEWRETGFRLMNADVVRIIAQDRLTDRTRVQLFDEALELGTTLGVLHTVREFVTHPQTEARGYFVDTRFPGLEGLPFATHPVKLSTTPSAIRGPAPEEGVDASGFRPRPDVEGSSEPATEGSLLLEGVRVVEFGVAAVVPELCGVLSELGAEVIKIESLAHPDVLRAAGGERINCSFAFNTECRGRKSVALDLTTPEGLELAMQLCESADIVAENNRGGVMERLGLGYEAVRARNEDVIYVSAQGYGLGGPFGEMPAFGPLNACFAGFHLLWNHPEAPYPAGTTLNHPDHITGKLLAVSVLAALDHRERTGQGQRLEASLAETVAYFVGDIYLDAARLDRDPEPLGNRHPAAAPHGVYPCDGDDSWIAVAVMDDDDWQHLLKVVGWDHDPALATLDGRLAARDELDERLAAWTVSRSAEDIAAMLQSEGVSAMPVMGPEDQHEDPHLLGRDAIVKLRHPEVGDERHVANPIKMSRLPQRTAASAPCLGADTEEVLGSLLNLGPEDVAALRDRGVCR